MKEIEDKEEALVICGAPTAEKDPLATEEDEKPEPKAIAEEDKSFVVDPMVEVKEEADAESNPSEETDNGDVPFQRRLVLRPRKTEPSGKEEPVKRRKSKTVKGEKKSAIDKTVEGVFVPSEMTVSRMMDTTVKPEFPSPETGEESGNDLESTTEVESEALDFVQGSSENEGGGSENLLPEDQSSKSKDNSESDTRVSSASENGVGKPSSTKRKRKRREMRWSKRKRKSEGKAPVGGVDEGSGWRELGDSSPLAHEVVVNGKRKGSEGSEGPQKKSREFAVPSPSLADISLKAAIPESTATSLEVSKPNLCLCRKKPQVFISGNNNAGDLYCQALDCIDSRIVGCCNPIPSQDVGLFRASEKSSYQMMCNVHQQRLLRHNCCPGCGLFCTQGRYMMCKSLHHFHKMCCIENEHDVLVCPHCGDDAQPKAVVVSFHSPKDPVFLPHQKPIRNMKSAKITITRQNSLVLEEEDPTFQFPASLFASMGDEASPLNGFVPALHRDKLAHLLNIACRSFSKMCCSNRYSYKSLLNASQSGDAEKLLKVIACGMDPNHVFEDFGKKTALHVAAANGHLSLVHILLQARAEINALDGEQNTPLTTAIIAKHNDIVKYLIKCGASLILKSEDGMTPLHIAAKCGNVGACFHILNGSHLPPRFIDSLDDGGWTPMVWASEFNHIEVVKFLMSRGADPLIKDAEQNIALHWAAFGGSLDIVELYLNDGSDINSVNVHGDTPLHIAARQDKYSCVLLLLARGARSDIKNKSGELPRDCSESPQSDIYKGITLNMEISALLTRFQGRNPKIISNDISRGKERNQIQCVNAVDDEEEPKDYIYVSESVFTSKITVDRTITSLQSCKCHDICSGDNCNCATISIRCWYDNDGRLKPDFNYADPPMIFECNQACSCNRITCRNRVVQNGISCRFQLFRTEGKGWGIKTLNLIPKGTYVCEYMGEIISDCEADHREDDSYLFDLDNRDGETYCIDARHYGNFARFINHMCVPNLMPVHVFVDHQDLRFPRIAFFANRDILPDEELGYNYGEKFWVIKWKSFTCTCGAEKCIYSENTIKTTLDNYNKKLLDENP